MRDLPPLAFLVRFLLRRWVNASSPLETTPSTATFLTATFYLKERTD